MHSENMQIKLVPVSFRPVSILVCEPRNSFFPSPSTCSPTAKTLLIRFPRKRFGRKGSERTVSLFENSTPQKFSVLSFDFPSRTWRQQVFRIFPTIANTSRARDGLNDARSFLRFEELSNWMRLVYFSKIKRINRPKEDKNKEKVNVQL